MKNEFKTALVFLAGGTGKRMHSSLPKQFLKLENKPLFTYSLDIFLSSPLISEIVIVCKQQYQKLFIEYYPTQKFKFALPGALRQFSTFNGLKKTSAKIDFICVHDSARPFITKLTLTKLFKAAFKHGAATLGASPKNTIKEVDKDEMVITTLDRSSLREIHTPQVIKKEWLQEGFNKILQENLTCTDDVSIVEHLHYPVKIVEDGYQNIKITTPEDLHLAQTLLSSACLKKNITTN